MYYNIDMNDRQGNTMTDNESWDKETLEDNEFAIVVDTEGTFQGIYAPYDIEDWDQLPDAILMMLATLYGDKASATLTANRILH